MKSKEVRILKNKRVLDLKILDLRKEFNDKITFEETLALFDAQEWKCFFCKEEFIFETKNSRKFSVDSIINEYENGFGHR
jgi:hypothetical protein